MYIFVYFFGGWVRWFFDLKFCFRNWQWNPMFEIHESRSDHSQHLLSSLISKKLQFTIFKIYVCSFDPRHPNASKSTRTDLLNAAANFFSAEFPTRKREVWGKLVHDKLKLIENQLLRRPPVRTQWAHLIHSLCSFPRWRLSNMVEPCWVASLQLESV